MADTCDLEGVIKVSTDGWGVGLYSADDEYRFWFATEVDRQRRPGPVPEGPFPAVDADTLLWIGLNPSRSDNNGSNRATLRTVLFWAERIGCRRVLGVNLYAYRHTDSGVIRRRLREGALDRVIGDGNDELLQYLEGGPAAVLLAWGSHGAYGGRGIRIAAMFPGSSVVGRCVNGEPLHPARKSRSLTFVPL